MKNFPIIFVVLILILASCSTNKRLLKRTQTRYGKTEFYIENDLKDNIYKKRLIASIDKNDYYIFYKDQIIKVSKDKKNLVYTLHNKEQSQIYNSENFKKLSKTDSIILSKGNDILDSLKWTDFKKYNRESGFVIEVNYYHGYPKNKRFKP
ncbi:MAG: hypothetical protein MUP24_00640 [Gillisia sp.]|nr:hypothetical protein [Gillisia sp.]